MSNLVPVSQKGAVWPSSSGATKRRQPGSHWIVRCHSCGAEGPTQGGGRCGTCRETVVPALAEVRDPARSYPPGWSVLQVDLFDYVPLAISIPLKLMGRLALVGFFLLTFFPLGLVLLFVSIRDGFGISWSNSNPEGVRNHVEHRLKVEAAWVDASRLRGRRGLVLQYKLQTYGLIKKRLEVAVRVRGPDGRYLPALLRNYRGDCGEVLVRHATAPLKSQSSRFERLWLFLPVRALPVPMAVQRMSVVIEAAFACEGKLYSESHLPYAFVPTADDRTPLALPQATIAPEADAPNAIIVLADVGPAEDTSCGVCGDSLQGEPVVRCSRCDAGTHKECWEYMQGCSTYACEGRPA